MAFSLLPRLVTRRLTDLSPAFLQRRGIRLLMLDFDNTVIPYTTDQPDEGILEWFDAMQEGGIELCVVSNSRRTRAKDFCAGRGIACITHAGKPFGSGIRRAMALFGFEPWQCAMVGDQIYTDTLGGNLAGVTSILVGSIENHNFWLKARHLLELPWIYAAKNRRIEHEES